MADRESMLEALLRLEETIAELSALAALAADLAGPADGAPEWPWLVAQMAKRITANADEVRERALQC